MNSLDEIVSDSKKIFYGEKEIRQVCKGEDLAWRRQAPYFYLEFINQPMPETN